MPPTTTSTAPLISVGSRCYIPDNKRVWLPVYVEDVDEQKQTATVLIEQEADDANSLEQRVVVQLQDKQGNRTVFPLQNTHLLSTTTGCDDMIELNHLHEAAILYNLKKRFHARLPYTYTGDICLALNPYQWLEELYTKDLHVKYLNQLRSRRGNNDANALPPHVYAVSVTAYRHMKQFMRNQSILVSGESGAGKTETTKILMDNLATIASSSSSSANARQETISKIIEVNPLLESFGNAKTKRNDNSSRFGKFTQLQFDNKHVLCGAKCETYLLEKTRVITQEEGERNYHIFYQLLYGSSTVEQQLYGLEEAASTSFAYVQQQDTSMIEKDKKNFDKTKQALRLLGLDNKQQEALFMVLSGILHLGQAQFSPSADNDEASYLETESASYSSVLLGLDVAAMDKALCNRTMKAGGEVYAVPLTVDKARSCRDALAKAIYAYVFDWMVLRINESLSADEQIVTGVIGVLDIFGFESFVHNSFEQLCINYANEKLQQKFTEDVFKAVQEEYQQEEITWDHIEYADNKDVLALIEGKMGIISLLNEEIVRPKGNEEGFVGKLATAYRQSKKIIEFPRISKTQFCIHHYAETVKYEATGFLEKHKDALLPDLSELMRSSSEEFVRYLFKKKEAATAASAAPTARNRRVGGGNGGDSASMTVGTQFKQSLNKLMENINLTNVNYIRCIKPNSIKSTAVIDERMVVDQLRCAGVIEAICIARAGYPNRLLHENFATEFDIFLTEQQQKSGEHLKNCMVLVKQFKLQMPEEYQMGKTKIYLQKGVLERLEHAKAEKLFSYVALIQAHWRGVQTRQMYREMRCALIVIQRRSKVFVAVLRLKRSKAAIAMIQRVYRGYVGRQEYYAVLCEDRALRIQSAWRGFLGRKVFMQMLCHDRATRIQCRVRQYFARKELYRLQAEYKAEQARLDDERRRQEALEREREKQRLIAEAKAKRLLREQSALTIQRYLRGYFGRCMFARIVRQAQEEERRRQEEEECLQREREEQQRIAEAKAKRLLREKSTVLIQKHIRGYLGRILFVQLLQAAAEEKRRLEEERKEQERLRLIAEEEERQRQLELEKQQYEQAAVTVQKVTRGRLARQKFVVLKLENEQEAKKQEELEAVLEENRRLKKQLEEVLQTNIEMEALVAEWKCEKEVLQASNNLRELELKQQISNQKKQLETVKNEYDALCEHLEKNSSGSTEPDDDSGSELEDNDPKNWDRESMISTTPSYFDNDRPSTDISKLLSRTTGPAPQKSKMQQRREFAAQKLRAGAKGITLAKKWVNTRKTKKAPLSPSDSPTSSHKF